MDESPGNTVQPAVSDSSVSHGANPLYPPSRTRGLKPPWPPGASGNPSGLTKDGRAPKVAKLEASLLSELERSGGMEALAKRWVMLAKKGNSTALSAILERLYPVPQEDKAAGRVVLEGLRLELTPTGGAALTMTRAEGLPGPGSDANSASRDSYGGAAAGTQFPGGSQSVHVPPLELVSGVPSPGATHVFEVEKADGCLETPG